MEKDTKKHKIIGTRRRDVVGFDVLVLETAQLLAGSGR